MPEVRGGQLSAAQTFPAANVFTQTATLAGMARRRGQRKGYLRIEGGSWLLTYRVYVPGKRLPDRVTKTIGPANGPGKLTEKQAQRFAWDHYLAPLDQAVLRPLSMVTLGEYWKLKYKPWLEASRKKTTRGQYISLFENYVMPALGETRLCELNSDMVEEVMASAKSAGKSPSTAKHIRKVISGMFTRAKKAKLVAGDNPAGLAEAPKPARTRQRVLLTPELGAALLSILPSALHPTHFPVSIEENVKCVVRPMPARWSHAYREMALTAAITSMNAAELCGLKWGFVNLTDDPAVFEGEVIAPREIAVRWHWKLGEYTSLKTNSRSRSLPIPEDLHALLSALKAATECGRPIDPVFASREGTPIDADNVRARFLVPAAKAVGLATIGWHAFRRAHATVANNIGMNPRDRQELLGHSSIEMTDRYTDEDRDRLRKGMQKVAQLFVVKKEVA